MKIVLFFFFLMSGIRSDLVIEDKEIVARFGRNGRYGFGQYSTPTSFVHVVIIINLHIY